MNIKCILVSLLLPIAFGCGTEDCPVDCEDKYKCVDHSDLCHAMKGQCENFFFRKCMRCACPKTCGVCGDSSSEESAESEPEATSPPSTPSPSSSPPPSSSPSPSSESTSTPADSSSTKMSMMSPKRKRYPSAKIQYCECNIWQYPELQEFINGLNHQNETQSEYGDQVTPEYIPGIRPTLVFVNANGGVENSTLISGWSVKKLKAYLDDNLEQVPAAKDGLGINVDGDNGTTIGRRNAVANVGGGGGGDDESEEEEEGDGKKEDYE